MFLKRLCETTSLSSHTGRINVKENRENHLPQCSSALHNLHQLLQTPTRIPIPLREDDHSDSRPLDCPHQFGCYVFPSSEFVVVNEGVDSGLFQCRVEVAREAVACVFASEAQEHVIHPMS
ncbi:hypothetical protein RchiOBHm_Chr7g0230991 [Rosa chinensis]|uniref:Uncharacterized protein n=1 Tax=Rosa chinensis TaxID=74649 RepID=A0A2P6PFL2_ROSCH|nr:hypothetical protein RchiOBHm_Chr7g0230991 [Rosa chinensis]